MSAIRTAAFETFQSRLEGYTLSDGTTPADLFNIAWRAAGEQIAANQWGQN